MNVSVVESVGVGLEHQAVCLHMKQRITVYLYARHNQTENLFSTFSQFGISLHKCYTIGLKPINTLLMTCIFKDIFEFNVLLIVLLLDSLFFCVDFK